MNKIIIKKSNLSDFSNEKAIRDFLAKNLFAELQYKYQKNDELFYVFHKLTFKNLCYKENIEIRDYGAKKPSYIDRYCFRYKDTYYAIEDYDYIDEGVLLRKLIEK